MIRPQMLSSTISKREEKAGFESEDERMETHLGENLTAQIVEAWNIHSRIVLYLLEGIPEEAHSSVAAKRGKTVRSHFFHVHNVQLMWLKSATPELLAGLVKLENEEACMKSEIGNSLKASGVAIESLLQKCLQDGGKVKRFKPNAVAFLEYLISHESYHSGKIEMTLRIAGSPIEYKVDYGLWEWGVR